MMLRSLDLIQSAGKPLEWRLERLALGKINLIVGKNACGKTKVLTAIRQLAGLISGDSKPGRMISNVSYAARMIDETSAVSTDYVLKIIDSGVAEEKLIIGGNELIQRGAGGVGTMWFEKQKQSLEFQVPLDQIACASRRDTIQHAYLESLYQWGHSSLYYRFNVPGKNLLVSFREEAAEIATNELAPLVENVSRFPAHLIYKLGLDEFGGQFKTSLINDMRRLDYPLEDVGLRVHDRVAKDSMPDRGAEDRLCLYVAEEGLREEITQFEMSDGMFRALCILIHINRATMGRKPACVIIDDIGEGLDYERSCLLIECLIEKAEQSGIQLIMATNDRFIMNRVPLRHWTVLNRERTDQGTRIRVYNYETHRKHFDDFALTGLNNFDFFATRFFEEGLGE